MQDTLEATTASRQRQAQALQQAYPWTRWPLITLAPMRHTSGPEAAVAVASAGGIGIVNPMFTKEALFADLQQVRVLLAESRYAALHAALPTHLPIGVGFLCWGVNLDHAAAAVAEFRPAFVWLYAPTNGQAEMDQWSQRLRGASPGTKIWHMVGTLDEVKHASSSPHAPDVLVVQGIEAGGHGRTSDGSSWSTLLPEASDLLRRNHADIPLFVAGGIADGRGVAAGLSLGAAGVVMGTRFLASSEARIARGYQDEVVRATDGAVNTTKTHLWNHLGGTYGWPKEYTPRGLINKSFTDLQDGVPFEDLQTRHDDLKRQGDAAWGPGGRAATYAGSGVGLVHQVKPAAEIVAEVRDEAMAIVRALAAFPPLS